MNQSNPKTPRRHSLRLQGYDYSEAGMYFVTICAKGKACLFGAIVDNNMFLNDAGRIVKRCWDDIPTHFPHVILHEYVVMPNHVHGIISIKDAGIKEVSSVASESRTKDFLPCVVWIFSAINLTI